MDELEFLKKALAAGLLTPKQQQECLDAQVAMVRADIQAMIWEVVVLKRMATQEQVNALLHGTQSPPKGTKFGPYMVEAKIGEGGMGAVYRAKKDGERRTVAIKILCLCRSSAVPWPIRSTA